VYSFVNDDKSSEMKNLIITQSKFLELNINSIISNQRDKKQVFEALKTNALYELDYERPPFQYLNSNKRTKVDIDFISV